MIKICKGFIHTCTYKKMLRTLSIYSNNYALKSRKNIICAWQMCQYRGLILEQNNS